MKKILIYTNHFFPENFKVNDIAFELAKNSNYQITVITGIPNYPNRKMFKKEYGVLTRSRETLNGVKIIRLPLIPRGSGSEVRLAINYLSFLISASLHAIYYGLTHKVDTIFVHHTSPVFIGIPAVIVKKIRKCKILFWNLDLWPESVQAASSVKSKFLHRSLLRLVKWVYSHVDEMLIGSKGFQNSLIEKGVRKDQVVYFPNWAEDIFLKEDFKPNALPFKRPEGFVIMFAGNIGEAQDFDTILKAVIRLRDYPIKWVFVGDGRKKNWIEEMIKQHQLEDIVHLPGRYPLDMMPTIFQAADLLLVSLKDYPIFKLTVPAKIQAYMASGKPIMAMLNGEGALLIKEAKCGRSCPAEDDYALTQNILELYSLSDEELQNLGYNGKNYYNNIFDKTRNLNKLVSLLEK